MTIFGPASANVGKEAQRFDRFGGSAVPQSRSSSLTPSKGPAVSQTPRKPDRGKKFTLTGWETEECPDDGIVAFVRRQGIWESKKGTRKQPDILNAEFYHPVTHQCPCVDDFVAFKKDSLHKRFHPKDRNNKRNKGLLPDISHPKNGQQSSGYGVLTSSGFEHKDMAHYIEKDFDKREIETYRERKHVEENETTRSAPVVNMNDQMRKEHDGREPRGMTYLNIKKLLKFTSSDRKRLNIDYDEDEGYSSKTSSAEAKEAESDLDGGDKGLSKSKMFSSMGNLTELPANGEGQDRNQIESDARIKFSYTHQPTILQLPDPNVQLLPERLRLERKFEREDTNTYARIKRAKELTRFYNVEQQSPRHESTVYDIDNLKPMTLVLRKISIQDADKSVTTNIIPHTWSSQVNYDRPVSNSPVRMHSRASRVGSGMSRSSSSQSQTDAKSYVKSRPQSQHSRVKNNIDPFVSPNESKFVTPDKAVNYKTLEKQATSYCFGDLLPAVDKNIYTNQLGKGRPVQDTGSRQETQVNDPPPGGDQSAGTGDGLVLLQKGNDLMSTSIGKNTLGPPPFRPNQTRHPLIRNVTVVVEKTKQMDSASTPRVGANATKTATFIQTPRIGSDKGIRTQLSPDKETKRKLKEAFTKFYQNRPKEIGKEFRRTQTMWQAN